MVAEIFGNLVFIWHHYYFLILHIFVLLVCLLLFVNHKSTSCRQPMKLKFIMQSNFNSTKRNIKKHIVFTSPLPQSPTCQGWPIQGGLYINTLLKCTYCQAQPKPSPSAKLSLKAELALFSFDQALTPAICMSIPNFQTCAEMPFPVLI